ncbi:MAG: hypothetical protein ACFCD0_08610 [Gemmataceae bacterium]
MHISFDIDDTLICYHPEIPQEPNRIPWLFRHWLHEPLRLGARDLLQELCRLGCRISIYTTSYRSRKSLKWMMWFYGIRIQEVINQYVHDDTFRRDQRRPPSKWPSIFGIDLHVDDSEGVAIEGKEYGFDVVVVDPFDRNWQRRC